MDCDAKSYMYPFKDVKYRPRFVIFLKPHISSNFGYKTTLIYLFWHSLFKYVARKAIPSPPVALYNLFTEYLQTFPISKSTREFDLPLYKHAILISYLRMTLNVRKWPLGTSKIQNVMGEHVPGKFGF